MVNFKMTALSKLEKWKYEILIVLVFAFWRAFLFDGSNFVTANISPLGAIALFSGAKIQNSAAKYTIPIGILLISDLLISENGFHLYDGWIWVYSSYLLAVFFGSKIGEKSKALNISYGCLAAALTHWLLADFGVWLGGINVLTGLPFPKTFEGLIQCYTLGYPFFQKVLFANCMYALALFGATNYLIRLILPRRKQVF